MHWSGRLFQQYIVDMAAKIEQNDLNWVRHNQKTLRANVYNGFSDALDSADGDASRVGKKLILPSSFSGSPRAMMQNYQDSMAVVRHYGKPDLFITMTCNPKWPEIKAELQSWEKAENRPDITARVFNLKLKELLHDLEHNHIFGRVLGIVYVVEFQKRGLPHAHILLILHPADKPHPDTYDEFVSAEIPDPTRNPKLFESVGKHMMHGPCGDCDPDAPCMNDPKCPGVCSKHYPKDFCDATITTQEGYPLHRRRDNGVTHPGRHNGRRPFTNQDVVPYNPFLIKKYNCHINVEICSSVKSVKYLYKYVI